MHLTLRWWPSRGRNITGFRTVPKSELTDGQWFLIADLFVELPMSSAGGRSRVAPRPCFEGILWILRTGARWQDLPVQYPSPATCWRRLQEWTESGVLHAAWERLLEQRSDLRRLRLDEAIADGTFAAAKKGARTSA
ncbi:transposase [Planctellipticum variicoloris]|nr:transposase [Planctomycetaceae bacterium SH412]